MFSIKRFLSVCLVLLTILPFIRVEAAADNTCEVSCVGGSVALLLDDNIYTYCDVTKVNFSSVKPLYGLYIKYDRMPASYKIVADGVVLETNKTDYLHQYVELSGQTDISIIFEKATSVADVFAFDSTDIPSWVQRWETLDKADIMVCPTHSDDDQLYFAGMLPWCAANGYYVQVVYFTNHWNTHDRPHELLDGLWNNGIKYYPVISELPDLYSTSLEGAKAAFATAGYHDEFFVDFYLQLFERYKPLVLACHDFNGEYGHGAHRLNTQSVVNAIDASISEKRFVVQKAYVHLWQQNKVTFNWDEPLEFFGGKSAFKISQESFEFHKSQHRFDSLYRWINGTEYAPISLAGEIRSYSPCEFGLYHSMVGMDTKTNGLFENITTYSDRDRELESVKDALCMHLDAYKGEFLIRHKPNIYFPNIKINDISSDSSVDISTDELIGKNNKSTHIILAVLLSAAVLFVFIKGIKKWKLKTTR